ncbi:MAG: hypothetical protein LIO85_05350 [Rikenellaceae bacterium]|nr:hypothetical protein [Rikenellaceae bacterium]
MEPKDKISKQQFEEIKDLFDRVIWSSSKKVVEADIAKLRFKSYGLSISAKRLFRDVVDYATTASGQPRDKQHWVSCAESSLWRFEMDAVSREEVSE